MLNCIIVDDEQPALNVIASYIKKTPYLNLVTTTTDAIEGINIVNDQSIDLVFLDIQMPFINGLEFIKAINGKSKVIITSAFKQYAMDGFELEVIDYLLKPISLARFLRATKKASSLLDKEQKTLNDLQRTRPAINIFEQNCKKYTLTPREIEIARLIQEGHTYKAIGDALFIAESTVAKHIQHIFEKTQASNKIELFRKLSL